MEKSEELDIHTQESVLTRKKRILIIDDSPEMLYLNKTLLEMDDYEATTALSGQEALTILSEIHAPDLILLDMHMADMSGPEFLVVLEEKRPEILENVPIVFLSAMDKVPVSKAAGFIRKPMGIEKFLEAVRRFIEMGSRHDQYKH